MSQQTASLLSKRVWARVFQERRGSKTPLGTTEYVLIKFIHAIASGWNLKGSVLTYMSGLSFIWYFVFTLDNITRPKTYFFNSNEYLVRNAHLSIYSTTIYSSGEVLR